MGPSSDDAYTGDVSIPSTFTTDGDTYTVVGVGDTAFKDCAEITSVTLPATITYIGDYAFTNCLNLTSIDYPSTLTSIGAYAFAATGLMELEIPSSVTSVGKGAFMNCTSLTSAQTDCSIGEISDYLLYYCTELDDVTIGLSVATIGSFSFADCTNLATIDLTTDNITSIEKMAFADCRNFATINLGNGIESIGTAAFRGCDGATSIYIGSATKTIGTSAFSGCYAAESLSIGCSVDTICPLAFYDVTELESVTCHATTPPVFIDDEDENGLFDEVVYSSATLYVPEGTETSYEETEPWSNFSDIEGSSSVGIAEILSSIDETKIIARNGGITILGADDVDVAIYNLAGQKITSGKTGSTIMLPVSGTYVVSVGGTTYKVIL